MILWRTRLRWAAVVFWALTLVGSVALGWHYAIDGYAGTLGDSDAGGLRGGYNGCPTEATNLIGARGDRGGRRGWRDVRRWRVIGQRQPWRRWR